MKNENEKFQVSVDGEAVYFDDPMPTASQIVEAAGLEPASEYVLIRLLHHETRSISLNETVDLRKDGNQAFVSFKSDRIYRFTVNDRGYEWGASPIDESTLRSIAGVKEHDILVLQRDEEDLYLEPNTEVVLSGAGTEHLITTKGLVTVSFNCVDREIPRKTYTTEELLALFQVQPGDLLNLVDSDGNFILLQPGKEIKVKDGMMFAAQPPCGGSA